MNGPLRRLLWPRSLAGKTTAAAVLLAAAIAVACFVAKNAMAKRLEAAWKLSEEFGLPRDFDSLFGEEIPDRENAAFPLEKAAEIASQFLTAERKRFNNATDDVVIQDPSYLAAMDRLLANGAYEKSLSDADRCTGYHSLAQFVKPLAFTQVTHLKAQQQLVWAEQAIARRLTTLGKREDNVRRLLRMSRLTRRWEDKEPFLMAVMINASIRSVINSELNLILRNGGPLPAALHDDIEREIAETENFLEILPRVSEVEKIMVVNLRDNWPLPGSRVVNQFHRNEDVAFMIRHIHGVARTFDRPYHQVKSDVDAYDADIVKLNRNRFQKTTHPSSTLLMPAMSIGRKAFDRIIALSRCLRIVNAMARRNDFAADLNSLGLPKVVLIDLFDGDPMRIKKTPNGPIVYSISHDLNDDGGTFKDVGLGPHGATTVGKQSP